MVKTNKLPLNVKKTHYVFFKANNLKDQFEIVIDRESIGELQNTKFLGIIIDSKLNWKDHISYMYIAGKVSLGICMIIKARNYWNQDGLMCYYYSFA